MNLLGLLSGIGICLGGIIGYIPQFYNIIKYDSVEGISEPTLLLMNVGLMCLTMNSIIFSWQYFFCKNAACYTNLMPFIQIFFSWVMVLIYYIIFIVYKFKNKKKKKRIFYGLQYLMTYLIFGIFVIALALGEKAEGNMKFFSLFADILGYSSAVLNSLVYLPQIYTLYKLKSRENLSILTYIIQTPGNLIIIFFQAVLYSSPFSTWVTYVVVLVEQTFILFLMVYYQCAYQSEDGGGDEESKENLIDGNYY